jgi:hypothetical protein
MWVWKPKQFSWKELGTMSSHGTYKTGSLEAQRIIRHSKRHLLYEQARLEGKLVESLKERGAYPRKRFDGRAVIEPWPIGG